MKKKKFTDKLKKIKESIKGYFRFLDKGNKVLDKMQKIIENHTTRVKEMKGVI